MKTIIKCDNCGIDFYRKNDFRKYGTKHNHAFCSYACFNQFQTRTNRVEIPCELCGKVVSREKSEFKKSKTGNVFCNQSCAASFHNTQRRKSRQSKCEILLLNLLQKEFPNLIILQGDKTVLDGYEVDIYIPSSKLRIE